MMDILRLLSLFDRYARDQDDFTAFTKMLDTFLLAFQLFATIEEEEKALSVIHNYEKKELVAELLNEIGKLSEGFQDPLGELFMRRISRGKNGQFFTPAHICDFMTAVTVSGLQEGQSVMDPNCGSGRMLLSSAKLNRKLLFHGTDIDATCVKIKVMNMLLQSLSREIAQMDCLSNDFFNCYRVDTLLKDGYHYPFFRFFTDPEESVIYHPMNNKQLLSSTPLAPVTIYKNSGIQGSLF